MTTESSSWFKTFLTVYIGQAFSLLGSMAINFALVWWITAETGSATMLAYAGVAAFLPQALVGPLAGPYIDRWDRRTTMIAADLFIAATSVVLIGMFASGTPAVATVIAIIAARSVGTAFHAPASQAAIPMYVPQDQLMRVAGWNFFLTSGMAMAGPVLGAFLLGIAPMSAVIAVDIVGALAATVSLMLVRIPHPQPCENDSQIPNVWREFADGWRELAQHRGLVVLTLAVAAICLLYIPVSSLFPLMTSAHFGRGALSASVVEFAFGGGMLAGSMVIGVLASRLSGTRLISLGIVLLGVTLVVSGMLSPSMFVAFVIVCVVMGLSAPLFSAPLTALFQTLIDPAKLGRVMSLYVTVTLIVSPLGLLLAGPLAQRFGVAAWFSAAGVLIAAIGAGVWFSPSVRVLDTHMAENEAMAADAVPEATGAE